MVLHQASHHTRYLTILFILLFQHAGMTKTPFSYCQGSFSENAYNTLSSRLDKMGSLWLPPSCSFLANPDFNSGLSSWTTGSNVNSTNDAVIGNAANLTGSGSYIFQSSTGLTAGRVYNLSFYGKVEGSPSSAVAVIRFKNSSNVVLNTTTISITATTYTAYNLSTTAPVGVSTMEVYALKSGSSGALKVDEFCVEETNPAIGTCILAQNTGFENGMTNWTISGGTVSNTTDKYAGASAAELISNGSSLNQRLAIQASTTYSMTGWAKVSSSAPSYAEVYLRWLDINGNTINSIIQPVLSNVTQYKQYTLLGTAPTNAVYAEIGAVKSGSSSRRLYVDEFCLSKANSLGGSSFSLTCGCSDNLLPNGSFDELSISSFPYTLSGKNVAAISNNNTAAASPWRTSTSSTYSYIVQDIPATVNNPQGDYFMWLPNNGDSWFSMVDFTNNLKLEDGEQYTLCFYAASWAGSLGSNGLPDGGTRPQIPAVVDLGISYSSGYVQAEAWSVPASPSFTNLSWRKYSYTFTYSSLNPISSFSIGNIRNNVGIAIDAVNLSKVNCPVEQACGPGGITYQRWTGISGSNIYELLSNPNYPNNYNESGILNSFQGQNGYGDNYGTRVIGYLRPTITGNYTFNVTSDDNSRLFLSTTTSPQNKTLIASVPGWTNVTEHTKYAQQTSGTIALTAGTKYYVELVQKEGGGLDHFQVYWKTPANSSWTIIPGANLTPICYPEVCSNGWDDDFDGLTDCEDPDCSASLLGTYTVTDENCGTGGGAIDLTIISTDQPLSFNWSDMPPTARWTFDGNLNDVSGNNHHSNGTFGSFVYTKDAVEGSSAIYFDGNSYVRYSVDNGFMEQPFSKLSLSLWLKPETLSGIQTIFDEGGSTSGRGIAMRLSNNTLVTRVRETGFADVSATFPSDGNWHHVAVVFDNGNLTMYIDGIPGSTATAIFTTVTGHGNNGGFASSIGGSVLNSSGTTYRGKMDDIRYYHEFGLSSSQVADLARNDGDRTNLFAGAYSVTVTSASGCSNSQTINVNSIANHTNGGTIVGDEASCAGAFDPSPITTAAPASGGGAGSTEYQWQSSINNGTTWSDILGATGSSYDPGVIAVTTMYRRAGRRIPCLAWVYSNIVTKSIITNYASGGTIAGNETICGGYDPTLISNTLDPFGGAGGTLDYQWQSSIDSVAWSDIAGANSATFDPLSITQTTYYRRGARRSPCTSFVYSDLVTKMVVANYTDPGLIAGDESSCASFDPDVISSVIAPSGGTGGTLNYQWQYSTDYGASWLDIGGANSETYDPTTIIQTTYYRRGARRSPCLAYVYSGAVIKMVVVNFNAGGVIAGDQSTCGSYDPFIISNAAFPSGGVDGIFTYQWAQSTDGGASWTLVPGQTGDTYDPPTISTTTWYRRQSRRAPCSTWINSNIVVKTVLPLPNFTIATHPNPSDYICEWTPYVFQATDMGAGATYVWDFGAYAMPSSATGIGPHQVTYNVPNGNVSTPTAVTLTGSIGGCSNSQTLNFDVRPQISVVGTSLIHPADCEINNGEISISANHPAFTNVQASIDGGLTWDDEPLHFDSLFSGIYEIRLRYDDGDCEYIYGSVTLIDPLSLSAEIHVAQTIGCTEDAFVFEAVRVNGMGTDFEWNFGTGATPSTATGLGPHTVTFSSSGSTNVLLSIKENFCTGYVDTMMTIVGNFTQAGTIGGSEDLCDVPMTSTNTSLSLPSGGYGGTAEYQWQVSEDDGSGGWTAWSDIPSANGTTYSAGSISVSSKYRRGARRAPCGAWVYSNEVLKRLSNVPLPMNDVYTSACPGILFYDYVSLNDGNLSNAIYSIETQPLNGSLDLDTDGEFVYTPNSLFCGTDQFTYRVCNNGTSCCATATVTIDMADYVAPQLLNIPANIQLSCDDEVPLPPIVDASENCHTINLGLNEASNQGVLDSCSIYSYQLTRTWTGSDYCGNNTSANQVINIQDITAPDIYRIYTLPNGKKMVAGVMENVSHRWKTVRFPVQFTTTPVVFAQIVTKNDPTPIVTRLRNISTSQFQMRVQEEENEDGIHGVESISWIAMEQGEVAGSLPYEIGSKLVSSSTANISFAQPLPTPGFIGTIQSFNENNPVNLRLTALSSTQASVFCQEETSFDPEINHGFETVGYMAMSGTGNLVNKDGEVIGEIGKLDLDSTTVTKTLVNKYHNPVVVFGGITYNGSQPCMVRVTNLNPTSFKARIEEWMYLDQYHLIENLTYMVVEGSIPFDRQVECSAIPAPPTIGVQIVGMDNCDVSTPLTITDSPFLFDCANDTLFTRTYHAQDECGNTTTLTQVYTLQDTTPPTFTPPADITVTCLVNLDSLPHLGDVVNEADNCSTGLQASYTDDNTNRFGCEGYVIRRWALIDNCGNSTSHNQLIYIYNPNDADGDGLADPFDLDDDNDGIPDVDEGSGDADGDGIPNSLDLDSDNDGIPDIIEAGFSDVNGDGVVDTFGQPDWDIDGDGLANIVDANDTNPSLAASDNFDPLDSQHDSDGDGIPNFLDLDSDNDGIPDLIEAGGVDTNGDGVIDYPIPGDPGSMEDADGDGFTDTYDPDDDSTYGIDNASDALITYDNGIYGGTNALGSDSDMDGKPNFLDLDSDNDGIVDLIEAGGVDKNGNGRIDTDDFTDINGNGFNDIYESFSLIFTDTDGPNDDGRPDDDDGNGSPYNGGDNDLDGIPNYLDTDSDNDNIRDIVEIGFSNLDVNKDGRIDTVVDINGDGLHDGASGVIFTDSDGSTFDGKPEDGVDSNTSAYGTTLSDGSYGQTNNQPDVDDDGDSIPNFLDTDSDNDFLLDNIEDVNGNGITDSGETGYLNPDTDGDFILDGVEDSNQNGQYDPGVETDPLNPDTDGDGLTDSEEDTNHNGIVDGSESDPRNPCDPVATPACFGIRLSINARLSGPLVGNYFTPIMSDLLREKGYLPTQEPYGALTTFDHIGGQGGLEVVPPSTFTVTGDNAIVDWVFIELRNHLDPQEVIATRSGLIQRDGDVVDVDGVSPVLFDLVASGEYYVVLRHRNHLGVSTLVPRMLTPTPAIINLTNNAAETYGNQSQVSVNGIKALWLGDLNSDGKSIFQGPGNDITSMFFRVVLDPLNGQQLANFVVQGYHREDVNLDGFTIFQGPGNDRSMMLLNSILKSPANTNLLTNFTILQQLP